MYKHIWIQSSKWKAMLERFSNLHDISNLLLPWSLEKVGVINISSLRRWYTIVYFCLYLIIVLYIEQITSLKILRTFLIKEFKLDFDYLLNISSSFWLSSCSFLTSSINELSTPSKWVTSCGQVSTVWSSWYKSANFLPLEQLILLKLVLCPLSWIHLLTFLKFRTRYM